MLLANHGGKNTELIFSSLYELLVAVILSAQCTDKRVNIVTPALFRAFPNVAALSRASLNEVKELIKSCTFFNNKASNLVKMAQSVMKDFNGQIPLDEKGLRSLAGVGQKTAHVVLIEYAGANLMAVDTHVFRVSHRLDLSNAKTPEATELDLTRLFKKDLGALHQAMVLFGRYVCKAKKPLCHECCVAKYCAQFANNNG